MNLNLDGAKNVRDFSEIKNREGRQIKKGRFIRACHLGDLTDRDAQILIENYHLKKIIDLRTQLEAAQKPDRSMPGVELVSLPIFKESAMGITHEDKSSDIRQMDLAKMAAMMPDMADLYRTMVTDEYSVGQFRKVFRHICNAVTADETVLWHCTEGKDRCGITSALFLALLDVDYNVILADYLKTNDVPSKNREMFYQMILAKTQNPELTDRLMRMFGAEQEFLDAAFSAIRETSGSVDNFIQEQLGISEEEKRSIKALCLQ